jgi:hypothetical protein
MKSTKKSIRALTRSYQRLDEGRPFDVTILLTLMSIPITASLRAAAADGQSSSLRVCPDIEGALQDRTEAVVSFRIVCGPGPQRRDCRALG